MKAQIRKVFQQTYFNKNSSKAMKRRKRIKNKFELIVVKTSIFNLYKSNPKAPTNSPNKP